MKTQARMMNFTKNFTSRTLNDEEVGRQLGLIISNQHHNEINTALDCTERFAYMSVQATSALATGRPSISTVRQVKWTPQIRTTRWRRRSNPINPERTISIHRRLSKRQTTPVIQSTLCPIHSEYYTVVLSFSTQNDDTRWRNISRRQVKRIRSGWGV